MVYQYDALNRLISAQGNGWAQTEAYDGFGNLLGRTGYGAAQSTTISTPVNAATNQLSGYTYDANGNLLSTGYTYDAENRVSYASSGLAQYGYDAQNKRVWEGTCNPNARSCYPSGAWPLNGETVTLFGADGKQMGSYGVSQNYTGTTVFGVAAKRTYFGGKLVGEMVSGVMEAVVQDRLGSVGRYYPYGEERNAPPLGNDQVKFGTYTRDSVTGNDYADQRYYSSVLGRFMTADPYQAAANGANNSSAPQSWNRCAYVLADPVNYHDSRGLFVEPDPEPDPGPSPGPQPIPRPVPADPPNANSPFPECNKSGYKGEDANLQFIAEYYDDAASIAKQYGVPTDWVLGWAAEESGYGHVDPQAIAQNNFYNESLPKGTVTGGWAGAVPCPPNAVAGWACFNSFSDSANAAFNKVGQTITSILSSNPGDSIADVFQTINNLYHWNTGSDAANYGQKIQDVISGNRNNLDLRIDCLKKNGYI